MAAGLRRPLLPWQRYVADVAGEMDTAGRFAYGTVIVSVPRRAGKSILTLATSLHRAHLIDLGRSWYTAQTGTDAATTFRDSWVPIVERSPVAGAYRVRRSNGSQAFTDRYSGGMLSIFAPTEGAVHGQDVDLATIDEAWAFAVAQGEAVEAAVAPAMATRPMPQLWIVSAGGTEDSTYWDARLARAEEWAAAGGTDGVALFDWGAGADDDPADPAVWARAHPAVGHTIDAAFLAGRRTIDGPAMWERAYLNRWARPSSLVTSGVVDRAAWAAAVDTAADLEAPVVVAFDVAPDRSSAAVAAACATPAGVLVSIVDHRRGVGWVAGRVLDVDPALVIADSLGGAPVAAQLAGRAGVDLVSASDLARACGVFVDAVHDGHLAHHAQAPLDDALAGAARRWFGDAWAWSRLRSDVDITPLVAATLAVFGVLVRQPGAAAIY